MSRGFRVNFSVPELQDALNQISVYDGKSRLKIEEAVSNSTKAISKGAKQRVPVRSGSLKKHITSRFDKRTVTGYVSAKRPHAHLVEFGHKGGVERPNKKKALHGDKLEGFAAKVNIPNVPEHPFMRPAFEDEKPNLIKNVTQAVKP